MGFKKLSHPAQAGIILAAGLVGLILILAFGASVDANRAAIPTSRPAPPPSTYQVVPSPAAVAPVAPAVPAGPKTTFGDGVWEVGVDIVPGRYKSPGPGENGFGSCYYARLKTGDGSFGDIIDNDLSQGPVTVTIKETDGLFDTNGCQDWVKQP
jgi:hypothetical protein